MAGRLGETRRQLPLAACGEAGGCAPAVGDTGTGAEERVAWSVEQNGGEAGEPVSGVEYDE